MWHQNEVVSKVDLSKLEEKKENRLEEELIDEFKNLRLEALDLTEQGLNLVTSYPDEVDKYNVYFTLTLKDVRTGKIYQAKEQLNKWHEEEALNKGDYFFEGIKAADLANLELIVGTNYHQILLEDSWQVDFSLEKNEQAISKKVNRLIKTEQGKVWLRKIELSALGLTIEGMSTVVGLQQLEQVTLNMKDGSVVPLTTTGMSGRMGTFNMYYEIQGEEITLETQNSVTTILREDLSQLRFIEIKDVESIIIEGVTIPLE